jgi:hypothetical protein
MLAPIRSVFGTSTENTSAATAELEGHGTVSGMSRVLHIGAEDGRHPPERRRRIPAPACNVEGGQMVNSPSRDRARVVAED